MPQEFDLLYPFERLQQFSYSNNIYFLSLYAGLRDYVKAKPYLEKPYFTFKCDGHWSPLGHRIVAELVGDYLVANEIVNGRKSVGY